MIDDEEETVDGPKVAARILNKLPVHARTRLFKALSERSPNIAEKISNDLFAFDDLTKVNASGIQLLIKAVEHKDLVLSFKTASTELKTYLIENMSQRKAQIVQEDFSSLGKIALSEVEESQRKIMLKLDELRKSGLVRTESDDDVWV